MILHFAKESDFKVSLTSHPGLVRLREQGGPQGLTGSLTGAPELTLGLPLPLPGSCCLQGGLSWWGL